MNSKVLLFLCALLIWIGLNFSVDPQVVLVGIGASALAALVAGDMFVQRIHLFVRLDRYLWFLYYIPVFIWECIKANVDVAWRVVHPDTPIRPGIVKVKTTLKSDAALTFLANSITLTPGTMVMDVDRENGFLYIHWIDVRTTDTRRATEMLVSKFERIIGKIFE